jgi:hypothetical protein
MKSLIKHAAFGVLGLAGSMSVAMAEVKLTDISEIAGTWKLESVAAAIDKPRIPENRIWEFRPDGVIVTSGFNRHFNRNDSFQFTYKVANGKIVTDDPGRAGKTIDYAVFKKEGNELILKGGLEGYYFFKKQ